MSTINSGIFKSFSSHYKVRKGVSLSLLIENEVDFALESRKEPNSILCEFVGL
jgi:hypothetical protein